LIQSKKRVLVLLLIGALLSLGMASTSAVMDATFNPHSGLNVLTSWDHLNATRYDSSDRVRDAWAQTNYTSHHTDNIDRPKTGKTTPVLLDARKARDGELEEAYALIEEYQLEYQPVQGERSNGKKYKFNKLFNFDDINQWRIHHPVHYVRTIDENGVAGESTTVKDLALQLCMTDAGKYYEPASSDTCTPDVKISRPETYTIFAEYDDKGGFNLGTHLSQINYSKSGHIKSMGNGDIYFEKGPKEDPSPLIRFLARAGIIDYYDEFVEENSEGDKFLRVRHVGSHGYGDVMFMPILTKAQAGL